MSLKKTDIKNSWQYLAKSFPNWFGPTALTLGIIFGICIGIPTGADIYQHWQNIESKNRAQTGINLLQTAATIIGGTAIFWNIVLSRRQLAASQEQNLTERFSVAVEQLGHEQTAVRIGGIYSLERIAQDSPRDHWSIMEVLAALVRDRRGLTDEGHTKPPLTYEKDIQAAILVIGRRNNSLDPESHSESHSLYLSYSDLNNLAAFKSDLSNIRFVGSNLQNANFYLSQLREASFWKASLINAKFQKANLSQAILQKANLQGADFRDCILKNADLKDANLKEVKGLTVQQITSAQNWQSATYDDELMVQLGLTSNG